MGSGEQPLAPYHFPIQFMPAMQGDDNIISVLLKFRR